ncbi:UDP-N-acetylglucosamine transferase subunit ALG14 homolog [Cololabis saira]|uniref:UDP-N-acetylglucosamine transferase subunit ALG14 homolog n=1 Tax=Cololabis saira TaxID=129043 RepID=UPI002AD229F6|nr:UDP-N-acetylglucosamine transferase subunit ALG14 homolog [Cololabis saira]
MLPLFTAGFPGLLGLLGLILVLLVLLVLVRVWIVLRTRPNLRHGPGKGKVSVLVVAGSGGHTTEILRLLGSMSTVYSPRTYIIADTDRMSEEKICSFEKQRRTGTDPAETDPQFSVHRIPRSREVHQSWFSSVLSTLNAFWFCVPLVFKIKPDMVLCNGPGTCVPPVVTALLLGVLGVQKVLIVYVESLCRVQTLSLTGRILYPLAHVFLVQWAGLRDKYPGSVFVGRVV